MACNFSNMNTKKLKVNIPEGYEIDRDNSTFEEIVFKKIENPSSELPKTWEEYYKHTKNSPSYYWNDCCKPNVVASVFSGFYNEFSTKERAKQYAALGKLLQLRDYWVKGYDTFSYIVCSNSCRSVFVCYWAGTTPYPLTFPTREMAEEFKECFEDLIKQAYPLI